MACGLETLVPQWISNMKLTIELVPKNLWGKNLRSLLSKEEWDILRKGCYRRADYVCEVCGGRGDEWPVECHEIWEYNDSTSIQRLAGLIALCPSCHEVKHFGRSSSVGKGETAHAQLSKVNGWTAAQTEHYLTQAFLEWRERSKSEWRLDISWVEKSGALVT